jgi:hypothetical protein
VRAPQSSATIETSTALLEGAVEARWPRSCGRTSWTLYREGGLRRLCVRFRDRTFVDGGGATWTEALDAAAKAPRQQRR